MKNLVVLFFAFFSLVLVSCSDVSDNSFLTNPVLEKSSETGPIQLTTPNYPYAYLYNFSKVEGVKYLNLEGQDVIEFYLEANAPRYSHLYVSVTYFNEVSSKLFFIDDIENQTFKLLGENLSRIQNITVYGVPLGNFSNEVVSPFANNTSMNSVLLNGWKVKDGTIYVECGGIWPSSLKSMFAEIFTKDKSYFVFLQRPWNTSFEIPGYGKYGVVGIKLFANHTLMESSDLSN